MPLVKDLHQLLVELKTGFERQWHREDLALYADGQLSLIDIAANEFCFGSAERSDPFGHFC